MQETMRSVDEYCPKCQATRHMVATVSQRSEVDANGDTKEIVTYSFHCETCHSFVRSEDREKVAEEGIEDEE